MIEEPEYQLIQKRGDLELRQYKPVLVAEAEVTADFKKAGNEGFRRLAGYIFGANHQRKKLAMTAPVSQVAGAVSTANQVSTQIPMTAPVGQENVDETHWIVSFTMPAKYDLTTIPEPDDEAIKLREIPSRTVAAIRYSGTWSQARYRRKLARLHNWLKQEGLQPQAAPVFARYNPPWTLWFLRRNEILVPVASRLRKAGAKP